MPERRRRTTPEPAAPSALPTRDELYRLLVENVTDYAILMLSPEGRVTTWTEGAERMLGWAEAEVVGQPFSTLYPPDDAAAAERDLRIAEAQVRCEAVAWRVRRDGTRLWASVVLTSLMDGDGRMVGYGVGVGGLPERGGAGGGPRVGAGVGLAALRGGEGRGGGWGVGRRAPPGGRGAARRYEESRQRYRSLFENNTDAICSFDLDGRLRTANPAAEALT